MRQVLAVLRLLGALAAPASAWCREMATEPWFPTAPTAAVSEPVSAIDGLVLLEQEVVSRPGVLLLDSLVKGRIKVPSNIELYAAEHSEKLIYCTKKLYKNQNMFGSEQACFEDTDNDGLFDGLRAGTALGLYQFRFASFIVGKREPIDGIRFRLLKTAHVKRDRVVISLTKIDIAKMRAVVTLRIEGFTPKNGGQVETVSLAKLPAVVNLAGAEIEFDRGSGGFTARVRAELPSSGVLRFLPQTY